MERKKVVSVGEERKKAAEEDTCRRFASFSWCGGERKKSERNKHDGCQRKEEKLMQEERRRANVRGFYYLSICLSAYLSLYLSFTIRKGERLYLSILAMERGEGEQKLEKPRLLSRLRLSAYFPHHRVCAKEAILHKEVLCFSFSSFSLPSLLSSDLPPYHFERIEGKERKRNTQEKRKRCGRKNGRCSKAKD